MFYSIAFDSSVVPDIEKTFREFSMIGVVKSVETLMNTSFTDQSVDKYTIVVHFYFWYDTNVTQIFQAQLARNEIVVHPLLPLYLLRRSDSTICQENTLLRQENAEIRGQCISMISDLGKINGNIEEIKKMISSGAHRTHMDSIRSELSDFANKYKPFKKSVRFDIVLCEDSSSDESEDHKVYPKETIRPAGSHKKTKARCPGCIDNQMNQMGHIGPNGCLGDEF